jgi:hypothetical protein
VFVGGDVHLGQHGRDVLAELRPHLVGARGVVNLEGPVGSTASMGQLANAAAGLPGLRRAGVVVAGVANNHARDFGAEGVERTLHALRGAGLYPAGGPAGAAEVAPGVVVTAHDLTDGVPGELAADLRRAKASNAGIQALIATFHVTGPALYSLRPELRDAVDVAVACGASLVAAHGTHQLARVERRVSEHGPSVIAWGLGNLVFDCPCTRERDGLVVRARFRHGQLVEARVLPIDAGLDGAPARPAADAALTFELLRKLGSSPLDVRGPWARV